MIEEFEDQIGGRAPPRPIEDRCDGGHVQGVERHPTRRIGLLEPAVDREVRPVDAAGSACGEVIE